MNKISILTLLICLSGSCNKSEKQNNDEETNANCFKLTSFSDWVEISFKSNYSIQVPKGFVGVGMVGFEGNMFSKNSKDNKIILNSCYCNSLFCLDFGDTLTIPIPTSIQVINNLSQSISLNKMEYFCQNAETVGILYYSNDDISRGKLYWKNDGTFKDALEIDFYLSELDIVNNIIESIKRR